MQSAIGIWKIRITQFGGIQKVVKDKKWLKCFEKLRFNLILLGGLFYTVDD